MLMPTGSHAGRLGDGESGVLLICPQMAVAVLEALKAVPGCTDAQAQSICSKLRESLGFTEDNLARADGIFMDLDPARLLRAQLTDAEQLTVQAAQKRLSGRYPVQHTGCCAMCMLHGWLLLHRARVLDLTQHAAHNWSSAGPAARPHARCHVTGLG